jgi:O-antigen/teichoic acid export membrane protein
MALPVQVQDLSSSSRPEEPAIFKVEQRPWESFLSGINTLSWSRIHQAGLSVADQALSVGGMFIVNVALARTQSKEEYGIFVLSYSVFTFLSGIHNAAILETYTVYGAGRYQKHYPAYASLLWRTNILLGLVLTATLALFWRVLAWAVPVIASLTILGMAITCGVLLTAAFVRRTFYVRGRPDLAAKFSLTFFFSCLVLLWISIRTGILDGFFAFVIVTLAWGVAGLSVLKELPRKGTNQNFAELEPRYWSEHWKYSRWVLVTAFVFQLTTQGYFWLSAALLSVKEVGNLRAIYNLVLPIDQVFTAIALLILPKMCSRYASKGMVGLLPAWRAYCFGWLLTSCGFAVVVRVLGKPVMHLLYAGRFDDVAPLVTVLAFLPAVMGIGHTLNVALKAAEKPDFVFYAYVCGGAITLFVGIPLIVYFGLRGAVYGMLFSAAAYSITLAAGFLYLASRQTKQAIPRSAT